MSTMISEVVLAAVCFYSAALLWRFQPMRDRSWGAVAALLTAIAASLGAVKYGTDINVAEWHRLATDIAKYIGMPLLGLAWLFAAWNWPRYSGGRLLLVVLVVGLFVCNRWLYVIPQYSELLAPFALALVAIPALSTVLTNREYSLLGLAGVAQFALASMVIGTQGSINGVLSVDIFHYVLAGGWISIAIALQNID